MEQAHKAWRVLPVKGIIIFVYFFLLRFALSIHIVMLGFLFRFGIIKLGIVFKKILQTSISRIVRIYEYM